MNATMIDPNMEEPKKGPVLKQEVTVSEPGEHVITLHTYDPQGALQQWNTAVGNKRFTEEAAYGRKAELTLRLKLIREEFRELSDEILDKVNDLALDNHDKMLKEAVDLLYVTYGFIEFMGYPAYAAFNEVHSSNMSKMGEDGKPIRRPDGKVLKGPNYREANIQAVLDSNH